MFACVVGGFSCLGPLARIDIACAHFQTFLFPSLSESGIVCLLRFCFLECTEGRELFVFSVSVSSNAYFTDVSMSIAASCFGSLCSAGMVDRLLYLSHRHIIHRVYYYRTSLQIMYGCKDSHLQPCSAQLPLRRSTATDITRIPTLNTHQYTKDIWAAIS